MSDCEEPKRIWISTCVPLWAVLVVTISVIMISIGGTTGILFLIRKMSSPTKASIKASHSSRRQQSSKRLPPGSAVLLMTDSASVRPSVKCPRRVVPPPSLSTEPRSCDPASDGRATNTAPSPVLTGPRGNGDDTSTDLPGLSKDGVAHEYHDPDDGTGGKKDTTENSVEKGGRSTNQQPTDDKKDTLDLLKSDMLDKKSKQHLTGTKLISVQKDGEDVAKK